ncbi:MAG: efflux RND transporter periplasmic adaptor subunit [Candidatus Omnitrophota bacterium]
MNSLSKTSCAFLTAVVIITSIGCQDPPDTTLDPNPSPIKPLAVFIAKPRIRDVTLTCEAVGTVRPWKIVRVSSEAPGPIERLYFEKGERVFKDALLAEIDSAKTKALCDQAQAQYDIAAANHKKMQSLSRPQEIDIAESALQQAKVQQQEAQRNYERLKSLRQTGNIAQSQLDVAETAYQVANRAMAAAEKRLELAQIGARQEDLAESAARLAQAEAALRLAQEQRHDSRILSPLDGTIVEKYVEEGEMVGAGAPIAVIVDASRVKIAARIPEKDIAKIAPGCTAIIRADALANITFEGTLSFLSVMADEVSHSFPAEAAVDNANGLLRAGMIARLQFVAERRENATLVKTDSLWSRGGKTGVFLIKENAAIFQPLKIGPSTGEWTIVEEGLQTDDVLAAAAPESLVNGQNVVIGGEMDWR